MTTYPDQMATLIATATQPAFCWLYPETIYCDLTNLPSELGEPINKEHAYYLLTQPYYELRNENDTFQFIKKALGKNSKINRRRIKRWIRENKDLYFESVSHIFSTRANDL